MTTLADLLGVDAPTVTRKVQQLEQEGFVARHPDPDDRRATRIELSPAGRRTLQRVLDAAGMIERTAIYSGNRVV